MLQTDHLFTDQQLIEGFLKPDESIFQHLYLQLRPRVLRAIASQGGSSADGSAFFLAAAADLSALLEKGTIPQNITFDDAFTQLALAHYQSWLSFRQSSPSETAALKEEKPHDSDYESLAIPTSNYLQPDIPESAPADEIYDQTLWLPSDSALSDTRKHIFTWKSMAKLRKGCTGSLFGQPAENTACRRELTAILRSSGDNPVDEFTLPEWAETALRRESDYRIWEKLRLYEQNISRGLTIDGFDRSSGNTIAKYLFLLLLFATLGYLSYAWFNKPKPAGEIFQEHFEPPQSLMADINSRFENDTSGIVRPPECEVLLKVADGLYAGKNYDRAMESLAAILEDENLPGCRSDALFAMCIVSLKREEPGEALQYLAKIDNIEAYGEDLYWYQSLAFVQLAKHSAGMRPAARKAVERFLENTKNETRRAEAQKILGEL